MTTAYRARAPQEAAVQAAWDYLCREANGTGIPGAAFAEDTEFTRPFGGQEARARIRVGTGLDIGLDLDDEAFSAMVALAHLPLPLPGRAACLKDAMLQQVRRCRWRSRYRFFPAVPEFAADTDCTAVALSALHRHHALDGPAACDQARELLSAAAPATEPHLHPGAVMVYWDDGAEPHAAARGRKQDAVVSANVLHTVYLTGLHRTPRGEDLAAATRGHVEDHLRSGRHEKGTRYYPSPAAFLHAASRACTAAPAASARLVRRLRQACRELGSPDDPLDLALLTIAAANLGLPEGQHERRERLAALQRADGAWPARPYFRMGRVPVYFGSAHLTTVFALRALQPCANEDIPR
ncbi:hypothetical protein [Streptomyces longispororuber]|uniref:hypothetical protein n=1 Tax=Streptomyces longispororuber TaxID=68230 RepID=UPI0021093FBB|nr:hypothetical protein [Streptomyces longispororuber]MCQ4210578.1 hypothetical protein [Streptomyces longispororuber]